MQDIEPTTSEALYGREQPTPAPTTAQAAPAHRLAIVPKDPPSVKPPAPGARMERRTVPDNDDQATAETVAMMCDYIRAGVKDPQCIAWARWAMDCFGMNVDDARAKFWAVFWCLKHAVKYRRDEPELFRIGERKARDLLTAPAVLVRQPQPAEDCDGFTMLACTLLQILGVPSYIVTAKVDPGDPSRWSHVFAMADVAGVGLCALDGSHGNAPGWMVPRSHIFGYQVWDLSGKPIHKKLPVVQPRLNGYEYQARGMGARPGAVRRRRRGMGDDSIDPDQSAIDALPVNQGLTDTELNNPWLFNTSPSSGLPQYQLAPAPVTTPGSTTAAAPSSLNTFLNDLFGTAGKVATVATAPAGSVVNPNGSITVGGGLATLTNSLAPYLPMLLVGGLIIFGLSSIGGSKGRS